MDLWGEYAFQSALCPPTYCAVGSESRFIKSRMSSAFHAVQRAETFTGLGYEAYLLSFVFRRRNVLRWSRP
jgi:hypothetical protein